MPNEPSSPGHHPIVDPDALPSVPERLEHAAAWSWRILLLGATGVAVGWVTLRLSVVTLPVFAALLLSAALWPVRMTLRDRGLGHTGAALTCFLLLVALVLVLVLLVGPPVAMQAGDLDETVRSGAADLPGKLGGLGIDPDDAQRAVDGAVDSLQDHAGVIGSGALEAVLAAANVAAAALLTLVLVFFFLKDGPRLWAGVLDLLPRERRDNVDKDGRAAFAALSSYIRAQALVATIDAIGIGLAVALVGAPLALPIAVLTFVLAFVPVVGAIVSGAVAALVALTFGGLGDALVVVVVVLLVQQLEGNVLFPLLVGRSVQMHPVVVLLSLATGAALAGVTGAVVAVPLMAAVTGVRNERRSRAIAPDPEPPPLVERAPSTA